MSPVKTERAISVIRSCAHVLSRAEDERALLNAICKIIVEESGYRLAWVGYRLNDAKKSVKPVAQAGFEAGYLESIEISWEDNENGKGPTGTAIRSRKPCAFQNILDNPDYAPWRLHALKRGYASSAAFPLIIENDVIGALNVYAPEPDAFDTEELSFLNDMAENITYGVRSLRERNRMKNAEAALRKTNSDMEAGIYEKTVESHHLSEQLSMILEHLPIVPYTCRAEGDFGGIYVGGQIKTITGYSAEDFVSKSSFWIDNIHPDDRDRVINEISSVPANIFYNAEYRFRKADGAYIWVEDKGRLVTNPDGTPAYIAGVWVDITKRKSAERELAAKETKYQQLVELIQEGIWAIDKNSYTTFANPKMAEMLGYTVEEMMGKHLFSFMDEEGVEISKRNIERRKQGIKEQHPFEFIRKDGARIYTLLEASAIFDGEGAHAGAVAGVMDVTSLKKAEDRLRESEAGWRSLVSNIPDVVITLDRQGRVTYINHTVSGRPVDEVHGQKLVDLIPATYREKAIELVEHVFNTGGEAEFEVEMNDLHNDRRIYSSKLGALVKDGVAESAILIGRDITDQRKHENELRESEERLRRLYEAAFEGLAIIEDHVITDFNPAFAEMFGYGEKEIAGMAAYCFICSEDWEKVDNATACDEVRSFELRCIRKDGSIFFAESHSKRIPYKGRMARIMAVRDITEQKKYEDELKKAKDMAEEATKLKDKFVSLVAHDLKSPFAGIIGLLRMLGSEPVIRPISSQKDILDKVIGSGDRLLKMIDEILNIGKLRTGKIQPHPKFADARLMVKMAEDRVRQMMDAKEITLKNIVPEDRRIFADTALLGEALHNLLTNAIKFSNRGGVVTVFIPASKPSTIAVKDNGVGVKEELRDNLFFHEEKTTTFGTEGEPGTGFGLPLSREIMHAMGGDLYFESVPDVETVFYAELPQVKPCVLIVDDESALRMLLRHYLKKLDVNTVEANNGEEAFSIIDSAPVDLVICDIAMPKMDGYQFLKKLRSVSPHTNIPVLMVTADHSAESREKVFLYGGNDYINKPVSPEDFIPRVKKLLF